MASNEKTTVKTENKKEEIKKTNAVMKTATSIPISCSSTANPSI